MNINFGKVERYFSNKGYGFVTRLMQSESKSAIFFHIKCIEKTHSDLAQRLKDNDIDDKYFWYEVENTKKGKQVCRVLKPSEINIENEPELFAKIRKIWLNTHKSISTSFRDHISEVLNKERICALDEEQEMFKTEKEERERLQRLERDNIKQAQQQRRLIVEEQNRLEMEEKRKEDQHNEQLANDEFEQLVIEIKNQGFFETAQVSNYIVYNNLGYKYPNISGILEMTNSKGKNWNFPAGFPPHIFAKLCSELNLQHRGTDARPVKFTAFKNVKELDIDDI